MYNPIDTIAAVSSPSNDHRVIIRISGPETFNVLNRIFTPPVAGNSGIASGKIINLDATVYLFRQPRSYTGDDLAEIHLWSNRAITEALIEKLLSLGARTASAGEFTARAYLNNKMDLAQAEAVNEVITASNTFQLAAAENLLTGRLGRSSKLIRELILDLLSRLEADLDFSVEDIAPANKADIIAKLSETVSRLKDLLANSIRSESTLDLPAVAIAGTPNAGKSTLLNKLLGRQRSIVSHQRKTTRDVLTGELELPRCRCVLFDCAGLIIKPENILDELAQQAAVEAIRNAMVVVFCVDITKPDWAEDLAVWKLLRCHCEESRFHRDDEAISFSIPIATKTDLLTQPDKICHSERSEESGEAILSNANYLPPNTPDASASPQHDKKNETQPPERSEHAQGDISDNITERLSKLNSLFGCDFLPISAHTNIGLDNLKTEIANQLTHDAIRTTHDTLALTARHRQALNNTIHDIVQAEKEIKAGSEELAAMMLRTAYNQLSDIEQHNLGMVSLSNHIDEQVLDRIFSRFCIGK